MLFFLSFSISVIQGLIPESKKPLSKNLSPSNPYPVAMEKKLQVQSDAAREAAKQLYLDKQSSGPDKSKIIEERASE